MFLCVFLPSYGTHGLNPVLPELERAFGLQGQSLPTLLSAMFAVGSTLAYLVIGPLSDRVGRARLLAPGIAAFALVHWATPFLMSVPVLAALRLCAGFAGGSVFVTANALVVDHIPYARRGRSMSFVWLGIPAALVIGVPLSAYLAPIRWDAYFFLAGGFACAAWLLVRRVLVVGLVPPSTPHATSRGFLKKLLERPPLLLAASSSFVVTVAVFLMFPVLASHSQRSFAYDAPMRANLWVLLGVSGVAGGWLSGVIADRVGKKNCVVVPLTVSAIAVWLLPLARSAVPFTMLALVLSALTTLRQGPYQAIVTELVPPTERGAYLAVTLTSASLGTAVGQALSGQLFDRVGFSGVAIGSGALLLLAAVLFALVKEPAIAAHGA
ncbi:MAG: MFS transporter [Planctomycetota bacterium]